MMRLLAVASVLALLSMEGSAYADVQAGVQKYLAGDYAGAIAEWEPFAAQEEPNALFNLGQVNRLGRGVPVNLKAAADFYKRAAKQGHIIAKANLGAIYYFSEAPLRNKAEAVKLWQDAAQAGEPRALFMLGVLLFNGEDLPRDWPRAYAYVKAANTAGIPEAPDILKEIESHITAEDRTKADAIQVAILPPASDQPASNGPGVQVYYGTQMAANNAAGGPDTSKTDTKLASNDPKDGVKLAAHNDTKPKPDAKTSPKPKEIKPKPTPAQTPPQPPKEEAMAKTETPAQPASNQVASTSAPESVSKQTASAAPASAAPATSANGDWRVQIGAYASQASAEQEWAEHLSKHRKVLENYSPVYSTAASGAIRVQVGSFTTRAQAIEKCNAFTKVGLACFVVKAS